MSTEKKVRMTVTLDANVLGALKRRAKKEERPVSWMANLILRGVLFRKG